MSTNPLNNLARSWWIPVIYGVIAILFGILALTMPIPTAMGIAVAIGAMALIEGLMGVIALFGKNLQISKGWLTLYAIISIIFGLLAIFNPLAIGLAMVIFMAAWLVIGGLYRILFAIQIRRAIHSEWLIILSGILAIILGIMLAVWPTSGLAIAVIWMGILALIYGIFQIMAGFRIRKLKS